MGFLNRYRELPHQGRLLEHIAENLRHLFNSRRGYGSPICDFGLSDPDPQANSQNASQQILMQLLEDVLRYERRIVGPRLETAGRTPDLVLHMELRGHVGNRPVLFHLQYDQGYGGVQVDIVHIE